MILLILGCSEYMVPGAQPCVESNYPGGHLLCLSPITFGHAELVCEDWGGGLAAPSEWDEPAEYNELVLEVDWLGGEAWTGLFGCEPDLCDVALPYVCQP